MQNAQRGAKNYTQGALAEHAVLQTYIQNGFTCLHQRWRGTFGEIDLIVRTPQVLVFVEVKSSKSHNRAINSLSPAQQKRILITAQEFLAAQPHDTDIRFDLATVIGTGDIRLIENVNLMG